MIWLPLFPEIARRFGRSTPTKIVSLRQRRAGRVMIRRTWPRASTSTSRPSRRVTVQGETTRCARRHLRGKQAIGAQRIADHIDDLIVPEPSADIEMIGNGIDCLGKLIDD